MKFFLTLAIGSLLLSPVVLAKTERIVSIGGANSEIVCALGACDLIVAVDTSSTFPAALKGLPKLGYARSLSLESIIAQKPDRILLDKEAGPPHVLRQLEASSIPITVVEGGDDVDGAKTRMRAIAKALNRVEKGEALVKEFETKLSQIQSLPKEGSKKRALFVYARGGKHLMVAGDKTPIATLLQLSGIENAVSGIEGFKPLTAEAVTLAKPDLIIMTTSGAESLGGKTGVFELPGMQWTPAAKTKALLLDEDLRLLTIGPRTADVVQAIHKVLKGKS